MYPSALKREKLFACVFECIKKGFYTKCHYWLRISVHLTNGFRVSVLEAYNVDINSVTADSRFPLSADGAMPVAYVCAIFSLRRLWPASLPPCRTLPCVGRRWPRAPVSWAAAVAWWGSHGTGLWPVVGRGRGGRWGARHWLKHTGSLKERCWGEVLCVWSRDLREPVYSGRGGGGAGLLHKNACVMTGAAERRNALHNPNTVEAGPRLRWQPFLPIYFSSLSTQSPALSVVHSIPGKMACAFIYGFRFTRICQQSIFTQCGWNLKPWTTLLQSFVYSGKIQRAGVLGPAVLQTQFSFSLLICSWWFAGVALYIPCLWPGEGSAMAENVFIFCNAALPFIRAAQDCCICVTRLFPVPSVLAEVTGFYSTICFDSPRCQTL